jgi:hypothetical protein
MLSHSVMHTALGRGLCSIAMCPFCASQALLLICYGVGIGAVHISCPCSDCVN